MNLGPYEVLGEIGRGGMGVVLRARSRDVPEGAAPIEVAIKLIPSSWNLDSARFDREKRLLAALGEADGFVPLLDAGESAQGSFLVMPLVEGGTLRDRLKVRRLRVAETIELARRLAAALGEAHSRGIVHRDLKPENILFTKEGKPLVADLGLAKHFRRDPPEGLSRSDSVSLSGAGEMIGTLGYMPPEQLNDSRTALPTADVFALGAILHECLTGRTPYDTAGLLAFVKAVETRAVAPLRSLNPETPEWLARVIDRAIEPDPGLRFRDGHALRLALEAPGAPRRMGLAAKAGILALLATAALGGAIALSRTPTVKPSPDAPAWYLALPAKGRPPLPLPRGLAFGASPGEYRHEKDGSVLVFVPGGPFRQGSLDGLPAERPVKRRTLPDVFVGKLEVTNAQFAAFVSATGYVTEAELEGWGWVLSAEQQRAVALAGACWRAPGGPTTLAPPGHPVVQVTWHDARSYCRWAGLRLPTEAEWEKAAAWEPEQDRARRFAWGGDLPAAGSPRTGNFADESLAKVFTRLSVVQGYDDHFERRAPVGSFPAGASPCGALDMIGNVSEWCADGYDPGFYATAPEANPLAPSAGIHRSVRGGSWATPPEILRAAYRGSAVSNHRSEDGGFRVARGVSPEVPPAPPGWFTDQVPANRPPLPLPDGMVFGANPGEYRNEEDGSVLVFVPERTFERKNLHTGVVSRVEVSAYFLGKYELTNERFERFVTATGYVTTAEKPGGKPGWIVDPGGRNWLETRGVTWRTPERPNERPPPDHPVVQVSAIDAEAYCVWARLRLPTEAEWENAAGWDPASKTSRRFAWGDAVPGSDGRLLANILDESYGRRYPGVPVIAGYDDHHVTTAPVGTFPEGAAPCGALDMTGNVREWTADAYEQNYFDGAPAKDPWNKPTKDSHRTLRGGCWSDGVENAQIDHRPALRPNVSNGASGFRVARSIRSTP